jgi:putative endonuclease|tara:strand:- start:518 stop:763 length:246 start_codon:yes stop_codon:yes gene_type:complete
VNWIVYILLCKDKTLYTGITNDINKRLKLHSRGEGAKYTKGRGPFKVIYKENFNSRSLSTKREIEIKKLSRKKKLALAKTF